MRFVICYSCRTAVQIGGDQQEIQSLIGNEDSTYPCITPLCNGRMRPVQFGRIPQDCQLRNSQYAHSSEPTKGSVLASGIRHP